MDPVDLDLLVLWVHVEITDNQEIQDLLDSVGYQADLVGLVDPGKLVFADLTEILDLMVHLDALVDEVFLDQTEVLVIPVLLDL